MFPRSIGLASTNASLELMAQKAARTQAPSSPAAQATRHAQPVPSTAVAFSVKVAFTAAQVDYGELVRKARPYGRGASDSVAAPWIVGDVASEDAAAVEASKALTSSFIAGNAGLQGMLRTQFSPLAGSAGASGQAALPSGMRASADADQRASFEAVAGFGPPEAEGSEGRIGFDNRLRDLAIGGPAAGARGVPGLQPRAREVTEANEDQRVWTGSGYEKVSGEGIDLMLLKRIINSQSLLHEIEAKHARSSGEPPSVETPAMPTVSLPLLGASRSGLSAPLGNTGLTSYLTPARSTSVHTRA